MTLSEIIFTIHSVSPDTIAALEETAEYKVFNKKERLVTQFGRCHSIYFISKGLCRGLHENDGREDTRWFAMEGDVVTSPAAWHGGDPALFSIEAITEVEAYVISFNDMRLILRNHPDLQQWVSQILMEQLYVLERRYMIIGTGDARSRYEALMNNRSQDIINQIPLKYIAQYLKITQETLSRIRAASSKTGFHPAQKYSQIDNKPL